MHSSEAEALAGFVTLDAIRHAAGVIAGAVVRTPLLPFGRPEPGDTLGRTKVTLKPESLQPIGAFKLRGAYYNIATLPEERRAAGVVAHSSGNHAQGVARAARLLGVRAVIVMPDDAPRVKVDRVREDGAEIVFVGPDSEERANRAAEIAERDGLSMVAPYDDVATITGQGTVGLEIVEQIAQIEGREGRDGRDADPRDGDPRDGDPRDGDPRDGDPRDGGSGAEPTPLTVLVPVGGGGLAAGVCIAVKSLRPDARVIGVEPELAADGRASLAAGHVVTWPSEKVGGTIADGQRTAHVGQIPFAIFRRHLDAIVAVGEDEIARAMVRAARETRLVLEPSGATTLAAWLFHESEIAAAGRVVCILSGGNVDPVLYRALLDRGEAAGG